MFISTFILSKSKIISEDSYNLQLIYLNRLLKFEQHFLCRPLFRSAGVVYLQGVPKLSEDLFIHPPTRVSVRRVNKKWLNIHPRKDELRPFYLTDKGLVWQFQRSQTLMETYFRQTIGDKMIRCNCLLNSTWKMQRNFLKNTILIAERRLYYLLFDKWCRKLFVHHQLHIYFPLDFFAWQASFSTFIFQY